MMNYFSEISTQSARAQQAWVILVGAAMERKTHTYQSLSNLMFNKDAPGVLSKILGHVAAYCKINDLPQINSLVVNKYTGIPGEGIPSSGSIENDIEWSVEDFSEEREKVYQTNWFDIVPPSAHELAEAWGTYIER